ncbi:hypothetical protein [Rhodanobacter umsongensis]
MSKGMFRKYAAAAVDAQEGTPAIGRAQARRQYRRIGHQEMDQARP